MSRAATPNAVYERTHTGLSSLVPSRAARRILDAALIAGRRTPDGVSADEMARLLMGPVLRDLSQVLPRDGVRRELRELARGLRAPDGQLERRRAPTPPTPTRGEGVEAGPEAVVEPVPTAVAQAAAEPAGPAPEPTSDRPPLPGSPDPVSLIEGRDVGTPVPPSRRASPSTTPSPPTTPTRPPDDVVAVHATSADDVAPRRRLPDDHELVLAALAPLDGVAGVATFDARGTPLGVRGELPDAVALGRVIAAGGRLLTRRAPLRTVCVGTTSAVLVAVPVPPHWLAVAGRSDLNLGAVYAALTALEEER